MAAFFTTGVPADVRTTPAGSVLEGRNDSSLTVFCLDTIPLGALGRRFRALRGQATIVQSPRDTVIAAFAGFHGPTSAFFAFSF
jgi:hypothetical protein